MSAAGKPGEDGGQVGPREVGDPEGFPLFHPLVAQLADADPRVRGVACWSLGQLRYRPGVRLLGRVLKRDGDPLVRMHAAQALAQMRGQAATQHLIQGLKDEDELVVETCVLSLGSLRDSQGLYPLEELAKRAAALPADLLGRVEWAIGKLKGLDDPGRRPDRRRGGVSKKIRGYLEVLQEEPRSGIAHNNLAVAYYHATEYELAVRHCRLAKELGARVNWLWDELAEAGYDPEKAVLSAADRAFLADPEAGVQALDAPPEAPAPGLRLVTEPRRTDLSRREARERGGEAAEAPPVRAYRIADHRKVVAKTAELDDREGERRGGEGDRRRQPRGDGDRRKRRRRRPRS